MLLLYTTNGPSARGLSRFTAKVGTSIDAIKTSDGNAAKALEDIFERQQTIPTKPTIQTRFISAIKPFAAFRLAYKAQLKHLFITTAARISDKVELLLDDSFEIDRNLDVIEETLDRIKHLAVNEIGDLPRTDALGALWTRLTSADDDEQHKSHTLLLRNMTEFYEKSSSLMKVTIPVLVTVEAELSDFRNDFAATKVIINKPLKVIIALLRKSAQQLRAGKTKLENIEDGEVQGQY